LLGLNGRLKEAGSNITVVAFIIMPAKNHSFTVEALRSQAEMKQLRHTVNQIQHSIGQRIFNSASK
jgi:glycogen(starch) synthase